MTVARCVRCALTPQLRQVEIGASTVTVVHALPELILGVEAIENHAVDRDGDKFHNDFDDAADQTPILQSADERVVDLILEKLLASVVLA